MKELIDSFGRVHKDLRISLTDKCNLRCSYCMPEDFNLWIPSKDHLTTPELVEIVKIAVNCGITEIRLTGGEPLLRQDIVEIVKKINELSSKYQRSVNPFLRQQILTVLETYLSDSIGSTSVAIEQKL